MRNFHRQKLGIVEKDWSDPALRDRGGQYTPEFDRIGRVRDEEKQGRATR